MNIKLKYHMVLLKFAPVEHRFITWRKYLENWKWIATENNNNKPQKNSCYFINFPTSFWRSVPKSNSVPQAGIKLGGYRPLMTLFMSCNQPKQKAWVILTQNFQYKNQRSSLTEQKVTVIIRGVQVDVKKWCVQKIELFNWMTPRQVSVKYSKSRTKSWIMKVLISCQWRASTANSISEWQSLQRPPTNIRVTCPLAKLAIKKTLYLVHSQ